MLWIGKAKDPFFGDVPEWKFEAGNAKHAKEVFQDLLRGRSPFFASCATEIWVEPASEQPDDAKTFAVFCRDNTGRKQASYPDTWEEAKELADVMSNFYDSVEICFGWENDWIHYDQDDVGMRLYSQFYAR